MRWRWLLIALLGLVEGAIIYALAALWLSDLGESFTLDLWLMAIAEPAVAVYGGVWTGLILLGQLLLVLPVRRPSGRRDRGAPLALSLAVAGAGCALLLSGLILALLELGGAWGPVKDNSSAWLWAMLIPLPAWLVCTPLLAAFSRRRRREAFLSRVAAGLFLGSMVEAAAVIPLDVMIRRRTSCYCEEATFFTLMFCGTVGLFAMGPAIVLPLVARRRKRWLRGHCDWCGYDMHGLRAGGGEPDRCPECGVGWKP